MQFHNFLAHLFAAERLDAKVTSAVYVPKTSSASCDQAIFVDQATEASLSCYAVLLEVDRFG